MCDHYNYDISLQKVFYFSYKQKFFGFTKSQSLEGLSQAVRWFPSRRLQDKWWVQIWGEADFVDSPSTVSCLIIEHPYLRIFLCVNSCHLYFLAFLKNITDINLCRKRIILLIEKILKDNSTKNVEKITVGILYQKDLEYVVSWTMTVKIYFISFGLAP